MEPNILTPSQIAKRWNCSIGTVRAMITSGDLPSFRIGRLMRVPEQALVKFEGRHQ